MGRRAVIGLALVSALAFTAANAASALAVETGQTAYTCVFEPGTGEFEDEHCDEPNANNEGDWSHEEIAQDVETEFHATNDTTGTSMPWILKSTFAGVAVETSCTGATWTGITTNKVVNGVMQNVGRNIEMHMTGCTVPKPAGGGCVIPNGTILIKGVKSTTFDNGAEMGVRFEPEVGTELVNIPFEKCKNAGLNGGHPLTGNAVATPQGATLYFEPGHGSLKFGTSAVTLETQITVRMAGGGNPIAFTTQ